MSIVLPFQGKRPIVGERCYVAPGAALVGDVVLGDESSVWFSAVLRGDDGYIRVGRRTNIQDGTVVHVTSKRWNTTIGDDVTIGHRAVIHGCTIEDGCLVGMGAVILDDAVIGANSVVGAGAVVTPRTKIPPGSMVLGTPARVARPLREEELFMGRFGAAAYLELCREYLGGEP
ncbi:MAG: gamma carbonic anhydrase family protein [Deltaproteobacteria bacterium]|nr:gamma carbonic anhydrase family protein [Deltaproteobacteria bacterium]